MASAAVSRGASAMAITAAAVPSIATCTLVRPWPASSSERRGQPVTRDAFALQQARRCRRRGGGRRRWPAGRAREPPRTMSARGICRPRCGGGLDDGLGERVLAVALGGGDEAQHLVLVDAVGGGDGDDLGLAARQRAGLVEDDGVQRRRLLERHRVLEQDAALGAEPGADHDRRRGGQPERVRAGDDHDGDGEQQRVLDVAADDEVPDDEGQGAADERDEHQPERRPVGEPLPGRLGVLRLLDELDDLRERGVSADGGRAGAQRAVLVDGRADELVAGGLLDRAGSRR